MSNEHITEGEASDTYRINKVRLADGRVTWTVVHYVDGVAKGGDAHWLTLRGATIAAGHYVAGRYAHPNAPRTIK